MRRRNRWTALLLTAAAVLALGLSGCQDLSGVKGLGGALLNPGSATAKPVTRSEVVSFAARIYAATDAYAKSGSSGAVSQNASSAAAVKAIVSMLDYGVLGQQVADAETAWAAGTTSTVGKQLATSSQDWKVWTGGKSGGDVFVAAAGAMESTTLPKAVQATAVITQLYLYPLYALGGTDKQLADAGQSVAAEVLPSGDEVRVTMTAVDAGGGTVPASSMTVTYRFSRDAAGKLRLAGFGTLDRSAFGRVMATLLPSDSPARGGTAVPTP